MISDPLQFLMTMIAFLCLACITILAVYGVSQLPLFQRTMRQRRQSSISIYENALIKTTQPYMDYIRELAYSGFSPSCEDFQDYLRARQLLCGWYYVNVSRPEQTEEMLIVHRPEEEDN